MDTYLDKIAAYICKCQFDDFPGEVVERAKEIICDTMACMALGAHEVEIDELIGRLTSFDKSGMSTVVGKGFRTEPFKAALINGTAGVSLELDEGSRYARGHPGIHVLPAALAMAEGKRLSGKDLLMAFILGYEIGARLGIAGNLRPSMHPHGSWGTIGAGVAVGKLMGYEPQAMKEMMNVISSLTLATSSRTMMEGGTVRNVYSGVSGFMAVLAHDLVQSGFTGERDGMGSVFGSVVSDEFSPEIMTRDLGKQFEIMRNYFKKHACIRANQAAIDALSSIMCKNTNTPIRTEDIQKIEVMTYAYAAKLAEKNPRNVFASRFSIPFALATFLFHGHAGVSGFGSKAFDNPDLKALAKKVTVIEDPFFTAMLPDRRGARVRMILADGRRIEAEDYGSKGEFDDPYSAEELKAKYFELTDSVWGEKVAGDVYLELMDLENKNDINEITSAIAPL